jgi:ribosomal protein S18 acetylase RimI-like enzyme
MTRIRLARPADNAAIAQVEHAAIMSHCAADYSARQLETWCERHSPEYYARVLETQELFVAEQEGRVVGFGQIDLETGQIKGIYVDPAASRKGVGEAILRHLEGIAKQHSWSTLRLVTSTSSVPFFEAQGYQVVGPFAHRLSEAVALPCMDMKKSGL